MKPKQKKLIKGISLIEAMVSISVFAIISVSLYGMFLFTGKLTADAKLRTLAIYLANEEMEQIKAMSYAQVGTVGGIPAGNLEQTRQITKSGYPFDVKTEVKYLDDELDGNFPDDDKPADYKVVRLDVGWRGSFENQEVVLISSVYPDYLSEEEGGGVLSINALNFEGIGVAGCDVKIVEPDLDPAVSILTKTDDLGNVVLYGLPAGANYQLEIVKSGWEQILTYPPYPETPFNPVNQHLTVVEGVMNTKTIGIDQLGDIEITVVDETGDPLDNFPLNISGGRIIGYTNAANPEPVYIFEEEELTTDSDGKLEIEATSGGNYSFSTEETDYELVTVDPANPFELAPGGDVTVTATYVDKNTDSFLIIVSDNETKEPLSDISVALTGPDEFSETELTDKQGRAFFWQEELPEGEYTVEINADEFESYSDTMELDDLVKKEIFLERIIVEE